MNDCIFCKIASGIVPSAKVYESDRVVAFLDASPMAKGHFLVVPKIHWRDLASTPHGGSASPDEAAALAELWRVVRAGVAAAVEVFGGGANVLQCTGIEAGQTVPHLHLHVIPRAKGGPVPPEFVSGAFAYAGDEDRAATASALRAAISRLLAS